MELLRMKLDKGSNHVSLLKTGYQARQHLHRRYALSSKDVRGITSGYACLFGEAGGPQLIDDLEDGHAAMLPRGNVAVNTVAVGGNDFSFPLASPSVAGMTDRGLSERMKAWRTQQGLSQRAAAELVGIHYSFWSKIENGAAEPTLLKKLQIEAVLGSTPGASQEQDQSPADRLRSPDLTYRMSELEAGLLSSIIGPCAEGDELLFDRSRRPSFDAVIMYESDKARTVGIYKPHPLGGQGLIFPLHHEQPVFFADAEIIGVATALVRPLRSRPEPSDSTSPKGRR